MIPLNPETVPIQISNSSHFLNPEKTEIPVVLRSTFVVLLARGGTIHSTTTSSVHLEMKIRFPDVARCNLLRPLVVSRTSCRTLPQKSYSRPALSYRIICGISAVITSFGGQN
eukprot:COSAG02_NODE_5062_length_4680_cov_3.865095_3_plen_113_part_00